VGTYDRPVIETANSSTRPVLRRVTEHSLAPVTVCTQAPPRLRGHAVLPRRLTALHVDRVKERRRVTWGHARPPASSAACAATLSAHLPGLILLQAREMDRQQRAPDWPAATSAIWPILPCLSSALPPSAGNTLATREVSNPPSTKKRKSKASSGLTSVMLILAESSCVHTICW
jgi:hypothetical protein